MSKRYHHTTQGLTYEPLDLDANRKNAPVDLRHQALSMATPLISMVENQSKEEGCHIALNRLVCRKKYEDLVAPGKEQDGYVEPMATLYGCTVEMPFSGQLTGIEHRKLALQVKMADARDDREAGVGFILQRHPLGQKGRSLFTIHIHIPWHCNMLVKTTSIITTIFNTF